MIGAVLDTNIVVSRQLTPSGPPGRVIDALDAGKFNAFTSDAILAEYEQILLLPRIAERHGLSEAEVRRIIIALRIKTIFVVPEPPFATAAPDPDDNMVLDCAVAGKADYIVTGDKGLLQLQEYRGIRIVTAVEFLALLDEHDQANPASADPPPAE